MHATTCHPERSARFLLPFAWRTPNAQSRDLPSCAALALSPYPLILFLRSMQALAKILFALALVLSLTGILSPPVALLSGILFGLLFTHPFAQPSRTAARILLQVSVVALGFGMNLFEVLKAGGNGFIYTALGILFAFLVGSALCGGSAIAAIGPIVQANEEEMAVSLGTVFILNSVALLIFPPIGNALHLSQSQFGLWAALAIHDTSSVVGAATKYGAQALIVGTTVKLARALWIVPLALVTAAVKRHRAQIQFPWFILFFVFAALANTYLPAQHSATKTFFTLGRFGLTATLFLIGTGISRGTLKEVGWRPLLQGVLLWVAVGLTSLYFIRIGLIAF